MKRWIRVGQLNKSRQGLASQRQTLSISTPDKMEDGDSDMDTCKLSAKTAKSIYDQYDRYKDDIAKITNKLK